MFGRMLSRFFERPMLKYLPEQFIVADIETTGLDPEKHELIEIAAIRVNRDYQDHLSFTALVRPSKKIPKRITEITGITNDMIASDGDSIEDVFPQFIEFIGDRRLVFYNAPFDMGFIDRVAGRMGHKIKNPVSDALDMARRAWPNLPSYKLVNLAKMGNLDSRGAHRALKDCQMTMTVYGAASSILRSAA